MKAKLLAAVPFLALSALTSQMAHAAVNTTLTLSGVIMPVACTLDVSNAGLFAFGNVAEPDLAASGKTKIGTLPNTYSVSCPGGARIALKVKDNRDGTESDSTGTVDSTYFGVNNDLAGNPIGYSHYELDAGPVINGNAGRYLSSLDSGQSWTPEGGLYTLDHQATANVSFTDAAGIAPVYVETATGTVNATLYFDDKAGLDLSQEFPVDGSATMELIYL